MAEQERALRFARSSSIESGRWAPAVPFRKRRRAFCYGSLCITVGLLLLLSPVVVPASRSALARLSLWWGPSGEADGVHPWATCGHAVLLLPSLVQPVHYDLQLAVRFAPRPGGGRKLEQQRQGSVGGARRAASEFATGAVRSGSGTSSVRLSSDALHGGSSGAGGWGPWGPPWPRWRRAAAAVGGSYGTAGSSTSRTGTDGGEEDVRGEVTIAVSVEVGGSCARGAPIAGCVGMRLRESGYMTRMQTLRSCRVCGAGVCQVVLCAHARPCSLEQRPTRCSGAIQISNTMMACRLSLWDALG